MSSKATRRPRHPKVLSQLDNPRPRGQRFDDNGHRYCDGWRVSGYWKGYRCNAFAKFDLGAFSFCGSHFALADAERKESSELTGSGEGGRTMLKPSLAKAVLRLDAIGEAKHWAQFAMIGRYNAMRHLKRRELIEDVNEPSRQRYLREEYTPGKATPWDAYPSRWRLTSKGLAEVKEITGPAPKR